MRVGFIGLGSQGGPMARRIAESGFALSLWARRLDTLESYKDLDVQVARTVAELGRACDHVGLCVVDDAGVQEICEELIPAMSPESRLVVHSTVHPDTCVDIARRAAVRGIDVLDAPVSGGGGGAAAGELTVMAGGAADVLEAARPVFESFAGSIFHLGEVGAGQKAKLLNNALMAAHVALGYGAMLAVGKLDLSPQSFRELIAVSSGRSFGFSVGARLTHPSSFAHGAMLLRKDVGLLREILDDDDVAAMFQKTTQSFLDDAAADPFVSVA